MQERTSDIRMLMVSYIPKMATFLNHNTLFTAFISEILKIVSEQEKICYQIRITGLYALQEFYLVIHTSKTFNQLIIDQILSLLKSNITNIRQVAVKVLKQIVVKTDESELQSAIIKALQEIGQRDSDLEVRFLAR